MRIEINSPDNPTSYNTIVDTGAMNTKIKEAFIGPEFITFAGEALVVMMRDTGFELLYSSEDGDKTITHIIHLKDGIVEHIGRHRS